MDNRLSTVFGNYLQYFPGIEYDDLLTLQSEHIKEAIPELVPRIKFENLFKKFIESVSNKNEVKVSDGSHNITSAPYVNETIGNAILEFASDLEPLFEDDAFNINGAADVPILSNTLTRSHDILITDASNKITTVQDIIDIPNIKLKIIITNHINGKKQIDEFDRVVIAKAVIHHLLVKEFYRVITKEEFIRLAKLIVKLFPQELLGTYYIPAVKNQPAEGKLFYAYQNYKKDLREAALIPKRSKALTTSDRSTDKPITLAEKSVAFKTLLEESENFDRIVELWNLCYEERQHLLNELSVFEYVRKFPGFSSVKGYELVTLDADKLLGTKTSQLSTVASKIILYASRKKRNCSEVRNLLAAFHELSTNVDNLDTVQQLYALKLLPLLMPLGKKKLNRTTVAQLFCPHLKTDSEAEKYNIEFKEDHKDTTLVLKPRLYFVGDLLSPNVQLHFADRQYHIENGLIGFDVLFKCFLGLSCSFPDETRHVWQFIQSEVYGIETEKERKSSTVLTFTQDIRNIVAD